MSDETGIDVYLGLDVGKGDHHATAVNRAGKKVFDKPLPNSEPKLRELFDRLQAKHGMVLVVVDQPASIGALPLAVARDSGCQVAYLPGLTMRRIADLYPGEAKTDARDAFIIADVHANVHARAGPDHSASISPCRWRSRPNRSASVQASRRRRIARSEAIGSQYPLDPERTTVSDRALKRSSHLDGWVGCRSWWGLLSGWCRMSCGCCSSGWCRRRLRGLRAVAGVGMATGRYWPRSSSLPPQVAPGSNCPQRRSGRRERQPTGGSPSGARRGCGPSCTAWSSTSSALAASWTGHAARSTR